MSRNWLKLMMAAGLVGLGACKENTSPVASLFNDSTVTADVAASSGDAMATMVKGMGDNETSVGMAPGVESLGMAGLAADYSRSRTCYDSTGAVVAGCSPLSSVRTIVTAATLNTTRNDTASTLGGATITFNGGVHRAWNDTLFRNFTAGSETSRTHSGLQTAFDTTSFQRAGVVDTVTRTHDEAATDSVRGVTWNLPRASNPFPVSGYIVRIDTVHATFTNATTSVSRTEIKHIKITFPADAQGNVVLTIDSKTCNLNLVTRRVTDCH
ncbi:MAG TPA: hypothetical protein VMU14_20100 [Acidimicrobiales bacterium]|nr:hypothetical protein [Acidimicrobiales bacterium]